MRKLNALFLIAALTFSLTACGNQANDIQEPDTDQFKESVLGDAEIVLEEDGYYLCRKTEADFSESKTFYGIYDSENETWALDYIVLTRALEDEQFSYCGDGIFVYDYLDDNAMCSQFLSPAKGGVFELHVASPGGGARSLADNYCGGSSTGYMFCGGYTILSLYGHNGRDLCLVTDAGNKTILDISEYGGGTLGHVCWDEQINVYHLEGTTKQYFLIYVYSQSEFVVIDNQTYTTKVAERENGTGYLTRVVLENGILQIRNLEGADGKRYYAEFDLEGNLITPAVEMEV